LTTHTQLEIFIPHERQGEYFTIPFEMPQNTASLTISYHYQRHSGTPNQIEGGHFTPKRQVNTIDLGLIAPDGTQAGASGSDKTTITLTETNATPGYIPQPLTAGEWQILVGAYKVAAEGVTVTYKIQFTFKQRQLLIGDIHTHTIASDGVLTLEELAAHAKRHSLDFLAITDHNQMAQSAILNQVEGLTLIPGVEWTHYLGHANFLGIDQPYDAPFFTNTPEEALSRFTSARERSALIIINHPCDDSCGFQFDLQKFPFDCLEIWNGPMRESNFKAVALWQSLLEAGQKIPAVGGSDYHKDGLFQILGGPCMGVYAMSNSPRDILDALRAGHSFIRFAPDGPTLEMRIDKAIIGDSMPWEPGQEVDIKATALKKGDILRIISKQGSKDVFQAPEDGEIALTYPVTKPGFIRLEIHRTFIPGLPPLPALIANPIYFDA
jgi:hypothetical protein